MPLPVVSQHSARKVLAVCQEIVHIIFGTNEVKRIGKRSLSNIVIRRHSDDGSKDSEMTLTQKIAESKGFSFYTDASLDVD